MKRGFTIGIKPLAQSLKAFLVKEKDQSGKTVLKNYPSTEDSYFEFTNKTLKEKLHPDKKNLSYEKDLKRYGTRIGLIDVADDRVVKERYQSLRPLKTPIKPSYLFEEKYKKDLERFGTKQGIIEVANDDPAKKKKTKAFPLNFSKAIHRQLNSEVKKRKAPPFTANPYGDVFRDFPCTQVTVQNSSNTEKVITLWGANKNVSLSSPLSTDVEDHVIAQQINIPQGLHPQGITVNPANQFIYIANQLSDSVTVLDSSNQIVKIIELGSLIPGFISPVALCANTEVSSSTYGYVFVACSVADSVAVIDLALNLVTSIPVGVRPVAIAFSSFTKRVFAVNMKSDKVSIIDAESLTGDDGPAMVTGTDPVGISIHPVSGDIYIANSLSDSIHVYDRFYNLITIINGVGQYPASITYNPANNTFYVTASESNIVFQIEPVFHSIIAFIAVGDSPYNSFFNSRNNYVYVQNRNDNTLTIIRPDYSIAGTLSLGEQNSGGVYNPFNDSIYISDTSANTINVIAYRLTSSTIQINSDYEVTKSDFKNSPAIVAHVRFVITGTERINGFRLSQFTPTGSIKSRVIPMEQYASPQNKQNILEVSGLAGTVIDGKMNWQFKLPGLHTVSILVWYRQFEIKNLLEKNYY